MDALKLAALDEDDLAVLSAHLQDAILRVGDATYLPREKRFAFVVNRFAWERTAAADGTFERRRAGVHFERVLSVKLRGIDRGEPETVLELLAVRFTPTDAPGGFVDLLFAGNKDVRLEVECIEAACRDLGPAWQVARCPGHRLEESA